MTQPSHHPPTGIGRFIGLGLKFCSWVFGILAVIGGISRIAKDPALSTFSIALGILLLPPVRKMIGRGLGVRLAQPAALGLGIALLVVFALLGSGLQKESEQEKQRLAALAKEQERQENELLARYPFVDRDSLHAWKNAAADSATNTAHTFAAFLQQQEQLHRQYLADSLAGAKKQYEDSIAGARRLREDSIAAARTRREDSLAQIREERRLAAEERRRERQYEQENAPETYNGHVVYTGPRGGRYYINSNGNKTYIR